MGFVAERRESAKWGVPGGVPRGDRAGQIGEMTPGIRSLDRPLDSPIRETQLLCNYHVANYPVTQVAAPTFRINASGMMSRNPRSEIHSTPLRHILPSGIFGLSRVGFPGRIC